MESAGSAHAETDHEMERSNTYSASAGAAALVGEDDAVHGEADGLTATDCAMQAISSLGELGQDKCQASRLQEALSRKDTATGLFQCTFCDKGFRGRVGLVRHVRVHTGEKPFKCHICGGSFKQKGTLTSHVRIHTGEMPFKCGRCDTKFRHVGNLRRHERRCSSLVDQSDAFVASLALSSFGDTTTVDDTVTSAPTFPSDAAVATSADFMDTTSAASFSSFPRAPPSNAVAGCSPAVSSLLLSSGPFTPFQPVEATHGAAFSTMPSCDWNVMASMYWLQQQQMILRQAALAAVSSSSRPSFLQAADEVKNMSTGLLPGAGALNAITLNAQLMAAQQQLQLGLHNHPTAKDDQDLGKRSRDLSQRTEFLQQTGDAASSNESKADASKRKRATW